MNTQVTMSFPACEPDHPPLSEWPTINLVQGICPKCGAFGDDRRSAGRHLRARQLVDEHQ